MTDWVRARRVGLPALLVLVLLGPGAPASAHSDLESSTPADGATLREAPSRVTLVFNKSVQAGFSRIAVTGPGDRRVSSGSPLDAGSRVEQPLGLSVAGVYTVAYRVVSADGHTIQGQLRFSYAPLRSTQRASISPSPTALAGPGSPTATASSARAETDGQRGNPGLLFLLVVVPVVAVLAAIGIVLATKKDPRAPRTTDDEVTPAAAGQAAEQGSAPSAARTDDGSG